MKVLSEKLKELRKQAGKTQTQVANVLGIQYFTLGKWEQGRAEPSSEDLIKLADYYSVSIDYLFGREDDLGNVKIGENVANNLSKSEREIIELYNKLDGYQQQDVVAMLRALAQRK